MLISNLNVNIRIFIIYLLSSLSPLCVKAQNWQWAKQFGGLNNDGVKTVSDANNIYLNGVFTFSCNVDTSVLLSNGYNDMFIAKYDLNGNNRVWLKQFGGNNSSPDIESGGLTLTSNSIYFSGNFYGTMTIDGISVVSTGGSDAFLAKFDLNGTCIWIKRAGGSAFDLSGKCVLDGSGNLYWSVNSTGPGTIDSFNTLSGNFLVKLNNTGTVQLVKNNMVIGGYAMDMKNLNNDLFIAGVTQNDTTIIDTDTLIANNVGDAFIAKCDLNGSSIWARRFGGALTDDHARGIEFDALNNVYVVGQYRDSMTIDGNTINNFGNRDMFVAKFSNSGINQWIRGCHATGTYGALAAGIAKDSENKFYIIGYFSGDAQFGNFNVNTTNPNDMFLVRYDQNGDCIGLRNFGTAMGYGVEVDANDDVLVSGGFEGMVNIGITTLTSFGMEDGFIAKTDAITGQGEGGERSANNQLIIYANPNAGKCTLTVPEDFLNEKNLDLRIFDNLGKLIQQHIIPMNDGKIRLNIESEAKGIYNIILSNKSKSYSGKIVIE